MKNIRILHLLPNLLSLYGEYGNVAILERVLTEQGFAVTMEHWNGGALELSHYDFIYIGSGTEDNLAEAVRRLMPHQDAIRGSIEGGTHWLATGNAMWVFGKNGLGVLPYQAEISPVRHMGDVLTAEAFGAPLVGYVNTSCVYTGIPEPLLHIHYGAKLGNEKGSADAEGIRYRNFYGTQLLGPVLVKNPHLLTHMAASLTGATFEFAPDSNIRRAYDNALSELSKRV